MEAPSSNRTPLRSVCFTGHRELPPRTTAAYRQLVKDTEAAIRRAFAAGARRFCCGGAEGFDLLCGKLVLLEKERHLDIQLVLLLPYTGFGERFSAQDRAELERQKKAAEEVVFLSTHYFPGCMALRNRQLVAEADVCIAKNNGGMIPPFSSFSFQQPYLGSMMLPSIALMRSRGLGNPSRSSLP